MQPSSLIFLVVIAIWAAFLVQHWLGRREHLSTARSMDRFSNAMRILDRAKQPRQEHAAAASPARLHRQQITVTRAEALLARDEDSTGARAGGGPGVAASARAGAGVLSERAKALSGKAIDSTRGLRSKAGTAPDGGADGGRGTAATPAQDQGAAARDASPRPRVSAEGRTREPVFGRAPRGVLVVGAAVLSVATSLLAAFGLVGLRYALLSLVLTGVAVWWLRRLVAAEQVAARRARRASAGSRAPRGDQSDGAWEPVAAGSRRSTPRPVRRAVVGASSAAAGAPGAAGGVAAAPRGTVAVGLGDVPASAGAGTRGAVAGTGAEPADVRPATAHAPGPRGRGVYDIAAVDAAAAPVIVATETVAAQRDGWQPVPVPPPTYTMKARAERPASPQPEDAPVVAPLLDDEDDDVASPYAVTDLRERARARLSG